MKTAISAVLLLGFGMGCLSACAGSVTYPPPEGSTELGEAAPKPVPTLMTRAIRFARDRYGDDDAFAINLPPGTPAAVYDEVIARLGAGRPMLEVGETAYHVTKVILRWSDAKVDLVYPRADGYYDFVTISFRRDLVRGYEFAGTRLWRTGNRPPPPHYAPQPVEAQAPPEEASPPQAASADDIEK
ncbi:MAG: hypothetical protein O7F17_06685 [Planctomycetota bacterium]|nr:hypothetical protein [Planctomycetota bacterium]